MSVKQIRNGIGVLGLALVLAMGAMAQSAAPEQKGKPEEKQAAAPGTLDPSSPEFANQYVVGESDTLRVTVWRETDLSQTVIVRPDGMISLPLLKDVHVAGMTPAEMEKFLADKLKAYITNPQVTVTVQEIRSRKAYITGEVVRPGPYPLLAPTTVLQLLSQAGGFTPFAKRGKIIVLREEGGKQVRYPFDYTKVVRGQNPDQNLMLRSGDTVVVP